MDLIRAELVRLCSSIHPMKDLSECETFVDNLMRQRRFDLNIKEQTQRIVIAAALKDIIDEELKIFADDTETPIQDKRDALSERFNQKFSERMALSFPGLDVNTN